MTVLLLLLLLLLLPVMMKWAEAESEYARPSPTASKRNFAIPGVFCLVLSF